MEFRRDFRIGELGDVSGLPRDPNILLSVINTDLRDKYRTLDELCVAIDADRGAVERTLDDIGYAYDEKTNQFKPV